MRVVRAIEPGAHKVEWKSERKPSEGEQKSGRAIWLSNRAERIDSQEVVTFERIYHQELGPRGDMQIPRSHYQRKIVFAKAEFEGYLIVGGKMLCFRDLEGLREVHKDQMLRRNPTIEIKYDQTISQCGSIRE